MGSIYVYFFITVFDTLVLVLIIVNGWKTSSPGSFKIRHDTAPHKSQVITAIPDAYHHYHTH